jgi:hypothetical protein
VSDISLCTCITLGHTLTDGAGGVLGWVVRSLHDTLQSLLSVCLARFAHATVRVCIVVVCRLCAVVTSDNLNVETRITDGD